MRGYRRFTEAQCQELKPYFKELIAIIVLLANQRVGIALRTIPCATVRGGLVIHKKTIIVTRHHLVMHQARHTKQWSPEEEALQQVLDMLVETLVPGKAILGVRFGESMQAQLHAILREKSSQDIRTTFRLVEEFAKRADAACLPRLLDA